jgi:signal peptidase II
MFVWICIVIGAVYLDQITKWLAVIFLQGNPPVPFIDWFIRFTYLENRGAAWGMLSDHRWVFMVLSTVAIIAVTLYVFIAKPKDPLLRVSLAFITAGGIGNMIDRVFLGYVVDFFEFTFIDFPVFNVADSFVCIGAAMLILYFVIDVIKDYKNGKQKADTAVGDGGRGGDEA